jgi:hypothetical protein
MNRFKHHFYTFNKLSKIRIMKLILFTVKYTAQSYNFVIVILSYY